MIEQELINQHKLYFFNILINIKIKIVGTQSQ